MKRFLSMLLCAAMLISLVPAAWAEEGADDAAVNLEGNQVELEPTDTFGNLVTNTLEDAAIEPDTSTSKSNSNIREVTIEGTNAYVTFFTETAAEIVVAIYSEDGFTMLGSGSTIVDADSDDAYVTIDIAEMPSYFLVGAYIMNPQSHEPLSEEYISREYTQEMQAFLSKTVADFDPERVLQLDGSPDNNFAVYSEDTIVINEGNSDGVVVTDNGDGTYTIVNSTPELLSLSPGATIAYNHVDGTAIVIKVSAVSVIGTSVIVSEDTDAALEDVFDYVKIDTSSYASELYIDNSDIDDCLTPISDPSQQMGRIRIDDEIKVTGSYDINSSRDANNNETKNETNAVCSVKGRLSVSFGAKAKIYLQGGWHFIEVKLPVGLTFTGSIKFNPEIPLTPSFEIKGPKIPGKLCPGVYLNATAAFVIEPEISISATFSATYELGLCYDDSRPEGDRFHWIKDGKVHAEAKAEGKLFVGIKLTAEVTAICDEIAKVSVSGKFGAEAVAELGGKSNLSDGAWQLDDDNIHSCNACIKGEIFFVASIDAKVGVLKVFNIDETLGKLKVKLWDFYYSVDNDQLEFNKTCPNIKYKVSVTALDDKKAPVEGAIVAATDASGAPIKISVLDDSGEVSIVDSIMTDKEGKAKIYLANGTYSVLVSTNTCSAQHNFKISGLSKKFNLILTPIKLNIVAIESKNGSFKVPEQAALGQKVKITEVTPYEGYRVGEVSIAYTDASNVEIKKVLDADADGNYSFKLDAKPLSDVNVEVKFVASSNLNIIYHIDDTLSRNYNYKANVYVGETQMEIERDAFTKTFKGVECPVDIVIGGVKAGELVDFTIGNGSINTDRYDYDAWVLYDGVKLITEIYAKTGDPKDYPYDERLSYAMPYVESGKTCDIHIKYALKDDSKYDLDLDVTGADVAASTLNGTSFSSIDSSTVKIGVGSLVEVVVIPDELHEQVGEARVTFTDNEDKLVDVLVNGYPRGDGAMVFTFGNKDNPPAINASPKGAVKFTLEMPSVAEANNEVVVYTNNWGYHFSTEPTYTISVNGDSSKKFAVAGDAITIKPNFSDLSIVDKVVGLISVGGELKFIDDITFDLLKGIWIIKLKDEPDIGTEISITFNLSKLETNTNSFATADADALESPAPTDEPQPEVTPEPDLPNIPDATPLPEPTIEPQPEPTPEAPDSPTNPGGDLTEDTAGSGSDAIQEQSELSASAVAAYSGILGTNGNMQTASFTGLLPGAEYVFAAIKSVDTSIFSASNLLYIGQGNAADDGTLSFSFIPRELYAEPVLMLYGLSGKRLDEAEIVIVTTNENGLPIRPRVTVTYKGTELEQANDYDYSIEYDERGDYIITVVGLGDYSGSVTKKAARYPIPVTAVEICADSSFLLVGDSVEFSALTKPSNATSGKVVWSIVDGDEYVTISRDGVLTAKAPGTATMRATAADYNEVYDEFAVTVNDHGIRITSNSNNHIHRGISTVLTATFVPENLTGTGIVWTLAAGDEEYASVKSGKNNTATVTAKNVTEAHDVTVIASAADGSVADAWHVITVVPAAAGVAVTDENGAAVTAKEINLNAETELTFVASVLPAGAEGNIVWTSSDTKGAFGTYTDNGDGTLYVSLDPNAKLGTVTLTATDTVSRRKAAVKLTTTRVSTGVEITGMASAPSQVIPDDALVSGQSIQLKAQVLGSPKANSVIWSIPDEYAPYAAVTAAGKLTAKAVTYPVEIEVVAHAKDGASETSAYVWIVPKVNAVALKVNGEALSGTAYNVNLNGTADALTVEAVTFPADAKENIQWTVSDTKNVYAEYDVSGGSVSVYGFKGKTGSVTLTAKATDGSNKTARVTLKFVRYANSIEILNAPEVISGGKSVTLRTNVQTDKTLTDKAVVWSVSAASAPYASINSSGSLKVQPAAVLVDIQVIATVKATGASTSCLITVTPNIAKRVDVLMNGEVVTGLTRTADLTDAVSLSAEVQPADEAVTWTSSSKAIAEVDANGTVTLKKAGTVTFTAATADKKTKATLKLTVVSRAQSISIVGGDQTVCGGGKLKLTAQLTPAKPTNSKVTWSIAPEYASYAGINSSGVLTAAKVTYTHRVVVSVVSNDDPAVRDEITVTISPAVNNMKVYADAPSVIDVGERDSVQLSVRSYPVEAMQDVTWKSSSANIASIDADGTVTVCRDAKTGLPKTGTVTFTATAADGSRKSASIKLTFTRKMDTLTIAGADIVGGGKSVTYKAVCDQYATNKKVIWSLSGDTDCATLNASGVLKAKAVTAPKYVTVTATAADGGGATASIDVVIYPIVTKVNIFLGSEVVTGKTLAGSMSDLDELALRVENSPARSNKGWTVTTSNKDVAASIDASGNISVSRVQGAVIKLNSVVTITVKATDGSNKTANVKLKLIDVN